MSEVAKKIDKAVKVLGTLSKLEKLKPEELKTVLKLTDSGDLEEAGNFILTAYGGGSGAWGEADAELSDAGNDAVRASKEEGVLAVVLDLASAIGEFGLPVILKLLGL